MAEIKVKPVETEEKSIAEKEEAVQKDSQYDKETDMYKVNLNEPKKEQDAVQEQKTEDGVLRGSSENEEVGEETKVELQDVREEKEIEETPVLEEVTDETNETNNTDKEGVDGSVEATEPAPEQEEVLPKEKTQEPIDYPENVIDLVKFMNETGGTLDDYVRLNADYTNVDENTLLVEYYKQTKPHLSYDEI